MNPPSTDQIAREAARLIELGKADSIRDAIRLVTDRVNERERPFLKLPGHGRVREHVRGFAMQSMGDAGYQESVRNVWRIAEEVMTVFEAFDPVLTGRAAKGQIDAGVTLHIRIYTNARIEELAEMIVGFDYNEPAIDTINTRRGRLNRLLFEEEGYAIVVTRCLPEMIADKSRNLISNDGIATLGLKELRSRL